MIRITTAVLLCLVVGLPAAAQIPIGSDQDWNSLRQTVHTFLLEARDYGFQMIDLAKRTTGLSDNQLYGVGMGVAAGLVVSNALSLGWLLSTGVIVSGGWGGKWIFDE